RRANRVLPGGATISGFAKPARISVGPPTTGRDVPPDDRVRVPPRLAAALRRGKPAGLGAGRQDTLEFRDSRRFRDSTGRPVGVCSVPVFQKAIGALRGPVLFAALAGLGVGLGCGNSGTLKVTKVAVATQKTGNLAFYLDVRNNGKPVPGLVEKDFKVYEDGKLVPPKKGKRALLDADVVSANFTIIQVDLSGPMADSEYLSDLAETVTHFAADLNERQEVAVNVFDGNDEVAPFLAFGAGKEQFRNLAEGIRKFRPRNRNSHLYGAVYPGISALEEKLAATAVSEKQATLVVFTDRGELAHTVGIEQMKEKLKGTNVQIYLIGV